MEGTFTKIFLNLFEAFIVLSAFLVLSRRHKYIVTKKISSLFFLVSYAIYSLLFSNFLPKGLDTVFIIFFTMFLIICLFDSNAFKSIIKCCLIFCGIFLLETLVLLIFALFFGADTQMQMKSNTFLVFSIGLCVKAIEIVAVYILYRTDFWSSWLDKDGKEDSSYWQMLVIVACCVAIIVTMIVAMCIDNSIKIYYGITLGIICMIMFFAMTMTFKEVRDVERMKYENKAIQKSVAQMKEFNDLMAKERHEYKNHLATIYGLCCLRKDDAFDRIKSYINEYASSKMIVNFNSNSGNDFVDAILNVKYNNALQRSVKIKVDFEHSLDNACINQHIIATIIANITQNAFEAITHAGLSDRYINISGKITENTYQLVISNNGPQITSDVLKRIFDTGFSTKVKSSNERGFGLSIVKNHIEQCNGTICIVSTQDETSFIIVLPLNKISKSKQTNFIQTEENWI